LKLNKEIFDNSFAAAQHTLESLDEKIVPRIESKKQVGETLEEFDRSMAIATAAFKHSTAD